MYGQLKKSYLVNSVALSTSSLEEFRTFRHLSCVCHGGGGDCWDAQRKKLRCGNIRKANFLIGRNENALKGPRTLVLK